MVLHCVKLTTVCKKIPTYSRKGSPKDHVGNEPREENGWPGIYNPKTRGRGAAALDEVLTNPQISLAVAFSPDKVKLELFTLQSPRVSSLSEHRSQDCYWDPGKFEKRDLLLEVPW